MTTSALPHTADGTRDRLLPKLRPYQATVAREILRRVHSHEGDSISVEIAR
jgi:hypothetical protein